MKSLPDGLGKDGRILGADNADSAVEVEGGNHGDAHLPGLALVRADHIVVAALRQARRGIPWIVAAFGGDAHQHGGVTDMLAALELCAEQPLHEGIGASPFLRPFLCR